MTTITYTPREAGELLRTVLRCTHQHTPEQQSLVQELRMRAHRAVSQAALFPITAEELRVVAGLHGATGGQS